jgi:chemotaxis signal transduction protein
LSGEIPADVPGAVVEGAPAPDARPARRACVVMLGGRPFAVDVVDAREVVMLDAITAVPGAPATLVGVMNLRGSVMPVVEARPALGLPVRAPIGRPRALVLADGEHRGAMLIERVLGLSAFDEVQPLTEPRHGALALGELVDEAGERATVLDGAALLRAVRTWKPIADPSPAVPADPEPEAPARTSGA